MSSLNKQLKLTNRLTALLSPHPEEYLVRNPEFTSLELSTDTH